MDQPGPQLLSVRRLSTFQRRRSSFVSRSEGIDNPALVVNEQRGRRDRVTLEVVPEETVNCITHSSVPGQLTSCSPDREPQIKLHGIEVSNVTPKTTRGTKLKDKKPIGRSTDPETAWDHDNSFNTRSCLSVGTILLVLLLIICGTVAAVAYYGGQTLSNTVDDDTKSNAPATNRQIHLAALSTTTTSTASPEDMTAHTTTSVTTKLSNTSEAYTTELPLTTIQTSSKIWTVTTSPPTSAIPDAGSTSDSPESIASSPNETITADVTKISTETTPQPTSDIPDGDPGSTTPPKETITVVSKTSFKLSTETSPQPTSDISDDDPRSTTTSPNETITVVVTKTSFKLSSETTSHLTSSSPDEDSTSDETGPSTTSPNEAITADVTKTSTVSTEKSPDEGNTDEPGRTTPPPEEAFTGDVTSTTDSSTEMDSRALKITPELTTEEIATHPSIMKLETHSTTVSPTRQSLIRDWLMMLSFPGPLQRLRLSDNN